MGKLFIFEHITHHVDTFKRRDAMNNQHQQRTIKNVGYRLGKRKRLFEKRCRISDFSLSFAVFGILVMLVETELIFAGVYEKDK
uniref:Small conductance calcium-activated potassium channel protein n=1 Tax=Schistosoma haematobium TaxID=6185 RepID=A0A094ZRS4_SCHHA